jgi:hypothetical protein
VGFTQRLHSIRCRDSVPASRVNPTTQMQMTMTATETVFRFGSRLRWLSMVDLRYKW